MIFRVVIDNADVPKQSDFSFFKKKTCHQEVYDLVGKAGQIPTKQHKTAHKQLFSEMCGCCSKLILQIRKSKTGLLALQMWLKPFISAPPSLSSIVQL